jgi:hypothetical protein
MNNRSEVAAGLPEYRAVGIVDDIFPTLKIEVVENGEVVRVIEFSDPRERFLKEDQPVSLAT